MTHSLKVAWFQPLSQVVKYQVKNWFQALAFKIQLVPLHAGQALGEAYRRCVPYKAGRCTSRIQL
jgi:hypothetical protein